MTKFRSISIFILIALYFCFILIVGPVSVWLLFNAVTWTGTGLAISGLISILLPATLLFGYLLPTHHRFWRGLSILLIFFLTTIIGFILVNTPTGQPSPTSPVSHRFTKPTRFARYTLPNIVPEVEQLNLGFSLITYVDAFFDAAQADRLSGLTLEIYQEMEDDPNFRELGSVMGWSYAEVLGQSFDVGHYYLYVPQHQKNEPLAAIVFLHGSAGNFKGYLWLWSKLAEKHRLVIIAPSYGFGNWQPPDSINVVTAALNDTRKIVQLDPERLYLAGLSNGGLGVSQVAEALPEQFRGLIFISPVMANEIVDSSTFQKDWRDRPILIITGEEDRRIPISYINRRIFNLENGGVAVTSKIYPDEDHFLFFSQKKDVFHVITEWLLRFDDKK